MTRKLIYMDPPYLGQAKRHYSHDPSGIPAEEVDYVQLIKSLQPFDGWALSASSPSIFTLVPIINTYFPLGSVRMGAWLKPFASWKPTHRVQYTWEPVFFKTPNDKGARGVPSVRDCEFSSHAVNVACVADSVVANITMRKGTHGAKPDAFNDWIVKLLDYQLSDSFIDAFPGTGGFSKALGRRMEEL